MRETKEGRFDTGLDKLCSMSEAELSEKFYKDRDVEP
jgi:hypothetical protein